MATKYLFTANGVNLAPYVERDSYSTSLEPVLTSSIVTMDGVEHAALIRYRGTLEITFNPQTAEEAAAICRELLRRPILVKYHCLQRNADVTARMVADDMTALFLSRCLASGADWIEMDNITLKEL